MRTIRSKITASIALVVLAVGTAAFVGLFLFMQARLTRQFDRSLESSAEVVGGLLQVDKGTLQVDEHDDALGEFRVSRKPAYFDVLDEHGVSLVRSPSLTAPLSPLPGQLGRAQRVTLPSGHPGRVLGLTVSPRIEPDDNGVVTATQPYPPVRVYLARDTDDLDETVGWVGVALFSTLAALLAVVAGVIPAMVGRGLAPLDGISARAARLDARNLTERFPTESLPAELAPIAARLNESLDRIAHAFERERRFAADAAHELRTPLAAIRANAEVAARWPEPEQVRESLGDIVKSSARLHRLIEQLLELSRLGNALHAGEGRCEDVNLGLLVQDAVARLGVGRDRISLQLAHCVQIRSTPDLLASLLDNLIANAVSHSPAGSPIVVRLVADPWQLEIANAAPALGADDMGRMFDPLWTKSTDRSAGHAGLGLALVAEYARVLSLSVVPLLDGAGGLTMVVTKAAEASSQGTPSMQSSHYRNPV